MIDPQDLRAKYKIDEETKKSIAQVIDKRLEEAMATAADKEHFYPNQLLKLVIEQPDARAYLLDSVLQEYEQRWKVERTSRPGGPNETIRELTFTEK